MRSKSAALIVASVLSAFGSSGASAAVNAPGLYFHQFSGAAQGSEWSTWTKLGGTDRFEFADVSGAGAYPSTVDSTGKITLDRGQGTGMFRSDGTASIDFTLGGGVRFHSEMHRAAHTDDRFPAFLDKAVLGDISFDGTWTARVHRVDPDTGATTLDVANRSLTVKVAGTTIRIGADDGWFVQAVWTAADQAAIRVVVPTPRNSRFRTFDGCEISPNLDCLGELRTRADGRMTLALFYQSRDPFGAQRQTAEYIELTRVPTPGVCMPLGLVLLSTTRRNRSRWGGFTGLPDR